MTNTSVKVENLSKVFKMYDKKIDRIIEWLTFGRYCTHKDFWALKNISFEIKKGESIGIIGPNGAGKSTLLKILSGALWPTTGKFGLSGKVVSLLELGTGFHPELTGIQNIYNSSNLLGFSHDYVQSKLQDIVEFAGIGDFIKQPVKTYSSGMYVRLAFALFANLEPDIYIVDEALAVGDVFFQQKCYKKLEDMKSKGTSIILVSHDPQPIVNFCDYAMLIDSGEIIEVGGPKEIIELYQANMYFKMSSTDSFQVDKVSGNVKFGDGSIDIFEVKIFNSNDIEANLFSVNENIKIIAKLKVIKKVESITVGFQIKNRLGNVLYGTNSNWMNTKLVSPGIGEEFLVEFNIKLSLGSGRYTVSLAAAEDKRHPEKIYVWDDNVISFEVVEDTYSSFGGEVYLPVNIKQVNL